MQNFKKTRPFLFSYYHDGCSWSLTLDAYDLADAEARAKKLGGLRLDGEVVAELPVAAGPLAKLACLFRNSVTPAYLQTSD